MIPTWRGVGYFKASDELNIDRYSEISGATVDYLDEYNLFAGWKTVFAKPGDKVRFNEVDFGKKAPKRIQMRLCSAAGATFRIYVGGKKKDIIFPAVADWTVMEVPTSMGAKGMQDITVELLAGSAEVDWISFK